ncbi:MAG TPA: hypothetical protein VKI44_33505 [Acetobacteraceae bacterium]|nr:hypothetical protein [Acetobacteraceae bacterium]
MWIARDVSSADPLANDTLRLIAGAGAGVWVGNGAIGSTRMPRAPNQMRRSVTAT